MNKRIFVLIVFVGLVILAWFAFQTTAPVDNEVVEETVFQDHKNATHLIEGEEATVSTSTLTFTYANWNTHRR